MQQSTGIPTDVRDRIESTANSLFLQLGGQSMPTVDQVRREARVDMNAASQVMREWRRKQTSQATPIVINIPEPVQNAATNAVIAIWQQAQELANENLKNAQSAWEHEQHELDTIRAELADAFELQSEELEQIKARLTEANALSAQNAKDLAEIKDKHQSAVTLSEKVEIKLAEVENNANTLRMERDEALRGAQLAHEKAAKFEGALEAIQTQNKLLHNRTYLHTISHWTYTLNRMNLHSKLYFASIYTRNIFSHEE